MAAASDLTVIPALAGELFGEHDPDAGVMTLRRDLDLGRVLAGAALLPDWQMRPAPSSPDALPVAAAPGDVPAVLAWWECQPATAQIREELLCAAELASGRRAPDLPAAGLLEAIRRALAPMAPAWQLDSVLRARLAWPASSGSGLQAWHVDKDAGFARWRDPAAGCVLQFPGGLEDSGAAAVLGPQPGTVRIWHGTRAHEDTALETRTGRSAVMTIGEAAASIQEAAEGASIFAAALARISTLSRPAPLERSSRPGTPGEPAVMRSAPQQVSASCVRDDVRQRTAGRLYRPDFEPVPARPAWPGMALEVPASPYQAPPAG